MRAPLAYSLAALAFIAGLHIGTAAAPSPRLVGIGCLGAAGPIYADSESDFPQCLTIERN